MNTDPLKGKTALITGGGRGIGRATAVRLAREGVTVIVCGRTKLELKETVDEIRQLSGQAEFFVADLAVPAQTQSMVSKILKTHHQINILINNASLLGLRVPLDEYPVDQWKAVLDVNLTGLFVLTQAVLRSMLLQKSGFIVNITSSVGRKGRAKWGAYAVSKFGVEGLTQVLAEDLKERNICVIAINPGATRTQMRAEAYPEEDPAKLKSPWKTAEVICSLLCQNPMALSGMSLDAETILEERKII